MTLNVMVLESEPNAAVVATRELQDAGHTVLTCHQPGNPAFPCRGLVEPATCPLRSHAVDVALVVRSGARVQPTVGEDGARCALIHGVPLVVAGTRVLDPYDDFATRTIDRACDVVVPCEEAARAPIEALGRKATAIVSDVMGALHTGDPSPRAEVTRRGGRLDVKVLHGETMTKQERSQASVRIVTALRELDPFAVGIDVAVPR